MGFWIISVAVPLSSLILPPEMSNLLWMPSSVFYILDMIVFMPWSSKWVLKISVSRHNFWIYWIKNSSNKWFNVLSAYSTICVSLGSVSINRFIFSLWVMISFFIAYLIVFDYAKCEFYPFGYWVFLYSYKYPWTLFWDGIKLLWNRSYMSAFIIFFRWVQNCARLRPLILYYIILLGTTQCVWTMCFSLWLAETGTVHYPVWALDTVL